MLAKRLRKNKPKQEEFNKKSNKSHAYTLFYAVTLKVVVNFLVFILEKDIPSMYS